MTDEQEANYTIWDAMQFMMKALLRYEDENKEDAGASIEYFLDDALKLAEQVHAALQTREECDPDTYTRPANSALMYHAAAVAETSPDKPVRCIVDCNSVFGTHNPAFLIGQSDFNVLRAATQKIKI